MLVALVMAVAACSPIAEVPAGAVEIDAEALEAAHAAWMAQGLPQPACGAPVMLEVSADELKEHTGYTACAAPHGGLCAYAGTDLYSYERPVMFYTPAAHGLPQLELLAHETFHVWVACTLGEHDGDYNHKRAAVWGQDGAIGFVDDVAGAPYRGYPELP